MTAITLTVNGGTISADPEPRLHLADFLREHLLLTGTHLGCEHGVCGACTLLIDGVPARSCIAFAAACDGLSIETIEGLAEDDVTQSLARAFTAEHALQCGFCTPGMLITARDIVLRLPQADDDRIRLELAGNLCRCTGYNGIVKSIRRVLDSRAGSAVPHSRTALSAITFSAVTTEPEVLPPAAAEAPGRGSRQLTATATLALPRQRVWQALLDPGLIAGCVPGAVLTKIDGRHLAGELSTRLGPIETRFLGEGSITYDEDSFAGALEGSGSDLTTRTRLRARARFRLMELDASVCRLELDITYDLQGPLAQFGRTAIVQAMVAEMTRIVTGNLQAGLLGETPPTRTASLGGVGLMLRVLWAWLRRGFGL